MADYNINERWSMFDRSKAFSPTGVPLPIINTLNLKVDDFYKDVPQRVCNRGLSHLFRRKNEMTASETVVPYYGIKSTKMGTQIVTEHVVKKGRLRSIDEVEFDGLDAPAIKAELRAQDESHIRQLGEDGVYAFWHGGITEDSANIRGLYDRLNALNPSGLNNVISLGNTNASYNTSIFIVEWDLEVGCYGLIPAAYMGKGPLGVKSTNEGRVKTMNPSDTERTYMALDARHNLYTGLAVGDNLKIARLSNVNTDEDGSNNFISGNGSRKLFKLLENGHFDRSKTRIYVNPDISTQFQILGNEKGNLSLTSQEVFGRRVLAFREIPVRVLDKVIITSTETVVA